MDGHFHESKTVKMYGLKAELPHGGKETKNCPQIGQEWQVGNTVHHMLHNV